ncbi:unnamed protein product [Prunus armeniaca]
MGDLWRAASTTWNFDFLFGRSLEEQGLGNSARENEMILKQLQQQGWGAGWGVFGPKKRFKQ